ncbi:CAP domain-containing protein [Ruminococcus flavefaciens]|uniref:CAP domain-containing protein n=1 Tax=Ruminococcus flavefaciens TaxID=1265 RepID=UPI0026F27A53|nr:CAP domain-containing protein [Ruminococcus flavefaciens]
MKKLLASVISIALTISAMLPITSFAAPDTAFVLGDNIVEASSANADAYAEQVVKLVNSERTKRGLQPVKALVSMNKAASIRAKEIVNKFDHVRPDGRSGLSAIDDEELIWFWIGENIAYGRGMFAYDSPEKVMNGWMNSDGHRENILNSRCKYIGVGYYEKLDDEGDLCTYWVQLFMDSGDVEYTDFPSVKVIQNEAAFEKGDVNGDNAINAIDASEVLTEYANVSSGRGSHFSAAQKTAADMNTNGTVDAVDASIILGIYASNATK